MEWVYATIVLALLEYSAMGALVGRARGQYGVKAPATTGHPDFERVNRVHVNTLESLIVFVPAVLLCALYVSETWAAVLGGVFVLARVVYAVGYIRAAELRAPGALVTGLVNAALLLGAAFGLARILF